MPDDDITRAKLFLTEELYLCQAIIEHGFSIVQNYEPLKHEDFIFSLILSNGIERYLKVFLHLIEFEGNGEFLSLNKMKGKFGHKIEKMADHLISIGFSDETLDKKPLLKADAIFLKEDEGLQLILKALSEFANRERYTFMNGVSNPKKSFNFISELWSPYLIHVIGEEKYYDLLGTDNLDVIYDIGFTELISNLKLFLRGIARIYIFSNPNPDLKTIAHASKFATIADSKIVL